MEKDAIQTVTESIVLKASGGAVLAAAPAFYEQTWWLSIVAVVGLFVIFSAVPDAIGRYKVAFAKLKIWIKRK